MSRKLSTKAQQLLDAFPGPVTLSPTPSSTFGLHVCGAVLCGLGVYWMIYPIVPTVVVGFICIAVGTFLIVWGLFQKSSGAGTLKLDDKGFSVKRAWGLPTRKKWSELACITTYPGGVNDFLMYVEHRHVKTLGINRARLRPFGGNYGYDKDDLAAAIDLWRHRASTHPEVPIEGDAG